MEDYRKIAIELGQTLISKAPETREDVERMLPELKESEDEKIRKALKQYFVNSFQNNGVAAICGVHVKDILAYLEKQEQHKKFRDSIQVGDKVTKNEDGVLVNLSQLNRVAKKDEQILANSAKTCKYEQKPAEWSEEDERYLNIVSSVIGSPSVQGIYDYHKVNPTDVSGWLKSLKDRVQPLKQEWSEEDDKMLNDIIRCGEHHCYLDAGNIAWLKSIAPPYYCDNCKLKKSIQGWKPSDEQMEVLKILVDTSKGFDHSKILESLYNDLKKLKEEDV